jgi:hypothetical protein
MPNIGAPAANIEATKDEVKDIVSELEHKTMIN